MRENEGIRGLPWDPSPFSNRVCQMALSDWSVFLFGTYADIFSISPETFLFYAFMHCASLDLMEMGSLFEPNRSNSFSLFFYCSFFLFVCFMFFVSPFFYCSFFFLFFCLSSFYFFFFSVSFFCFFLFLFFSISFIFLFFFSYFVPFSFFFSSLFLGVGS